MVKPALRKQIAAYLEREHLLSQRRSCDLSGISRRTYRYKSIKPPDEDLIDKLTELAKNHPGYGFWKLYHKLRSSGHHWNHKKVYRVYKQLGMNIVKRSRRRLPTRIQQPIEIPPRSGECWSMDFMQDSLYCGQRFRLLNIADDYNREMVAMEIGYSIGGERVVRVLERLKEQGKKPLQIRVDNGPEFISKVFQRWAKENQVKIHYIQPGKPTQNSLIERINRSCREELLNPYIFDSLQQVEIKATQWQWEYNHQRPHKSLGYKSPKQFELMNYNN